MTSDDQLILSSREGVAGIIRLNRPRALNALTLEMVREATIAFGRFQSDPDVLLVLLEAEGERAFCAGGDIRAVAESGRKGDGIAEAFWREEYELISRLAHSPKPVVALMDGIVMGGGAGLTMHLRHRVMSERVRFAMPEVGIGFLPDVGATYRLPRLPKAFGRFLAMTGESVGAGDAIAAGLADACVPSARLPDLREALTQLDAAGASRAGIDALIARYRVPLEPEISARHGTLIERAFARPDLCGILRELRAESGDDTARTFAARTAATMDGRSPYSLALTLDLLEAGAGFPSLEACLVREFRAACYCLGVADFYEGVRAAVIDKDRDPRWPSAAPGWQQPSLGTIEAQQNGTPAPRFDRGVGS